MSNTETLPKLYIKDRVIFPNMIFSIVLKDKNSVQVLNDAYSNGKQIFTVLKTDKKAYQVGTISTVLGFSKAKNGYIALIYGVQKAIELKFNNELSTVKILDKGTITNMDRYEFSITYNRVIDILHKFQEVSNKAVVDDNFLALLKQVPPSQAINIIATKVSISPDVAQEIFETSDILNKLNRLYFAILDQIRIIMNLSGYDKLPKEIKNILLFMNTSTNDDTLLVLGFIINDYLKHKHLSKEQTKAIQELRKSLLLNANNGIIN